MQREQIHYKSPPRTGRILARGRPRRLQLLSPHANQRDRQSHVRTKKSIPRFLAIILIVILTVMNYEWMPAVLFLAYLLYGVLRPWLSRDWRREIEEEIGEEPSDETAEQAR